MALGILVEAGGTKVSLEVEPVPSNEATIRAKLQARADKIRALRDKVKAGTATAAEKDRLMVKLSSQVLGLTDDLDDA
jgi:hypothetical protein